MPTGIAVDRGPAGDEARAVERLVLVEPRAVDDPGEHLARIEGNRGGPLRRCRAARPGRKTARRPGRGRSGAELAPVEPSDDLAAEADRVELVDGEVVGETRDPRVHRAPPNSSSVEVLAGGHLHQRGAAEEDLRRLFDHDDVVAHPGHVGARPRSSCRRRARPSGSRPPSAGSGRGRSGLPGMNSSAWVGRSAPPDSTRFTTGSRFSRAMSRAPQGLAQREGVASRRLGPSGRWRRRGTRCRR